MHKLNNPSYQSCIIPFLYAPCTVNKMIPQTTSISFTFMVIKGMLNIDKIKPIPHLLIMARVQITLLSQFNIHSAKIYGSTHDVDPP